MSEKVTKFIKSIPNKILERYVPWITLTAIGLCVYIGSSWHAQAMTNFSEVKEDNKELTKNSTEHNIRLTKIEERNKQFREDIASIKIELKEINQDLKKILIKLNAQ